MPSRLFIYYNGRAREGTTESDCGAMLRDVIKGVAKEGVCAEILWPFAVEKVTVKPSRECYREGKDHQVLSYRRVPQVLNQMKGCLASGFPFVFGFSVYESFESADVARTGRVPLPKSGERVLGGHAVLAAGYDDATQRFTVRNSWGAKWGAKGYCFMPYAYLSDPNLAADFWTIRMVEVPADIRG